MRVNSADLGSASDDPPQPQVGQRDISTGNRSRSLKTISRHLGFSAISV